MVTHRHGKSPPTIILINFDLVNPPTGFHETAVTTCKNPLLDTLQKIIRLTLPTRRRAGNVTTPIRLIKCLRQLKIHLSFQRQALPAAHLISPSVLGKQAISRMSLALIATDQRKVTVKRNDTDPWIVLHLPPVPRMSFVVFTTIPQWTQRALQHPSCRICRSVVIRLRAGIIKSQGKNLDHRLHHLSTGTLQCYAVILTNNRPNLLH